MARLVTSGFELNSATAGIEMTFVSTGFSTITSTAKNVRSGGFALSQSASNTTTLVAFSAAASDQTTKVYLRSYVFLTSYPTTSNCYLMIVGSGAGSTGVQTGLILETNGTLTLRNGSRTQVGSASSVLPLNTWIRLELSMDGATSPSQIEGRINGVTFAVGSDNIQRVWRGIMLGPYDNGTGCSAFYDDIAVNDSTGSFQNSWPGDGKVECLRPTAAGDSNQWLDTAASAGTTNNFTLVDETPPNDATDLIKSGTLNDVDMYNVTDLSGGDGSSTYKINVVQIGARFNNDTADATTAFKVRAEKAASGTVSESAAIIPNSVTWKTNSTTTAVGFPLTLHQDPDSVNWTKETINTMQIGAKLTATNVNKVQVTALWAYVDYTPLQPIPFNNYQFVKVGNGMWSNERIR